MRYPSDGDFFNCRRKSLKAITPGILLTSYSKSFRKVLKSCVLTACSKLLKFVDKLDGTIRLGCYSNKTDTVMI